MNTTTLQRPPVAQLDPTTKDLSHVPCKFYKANSCTAGASCPFSHDLVNAGQSKPICQWFAKGNCKFGHKCALAHVLPGQPMSFDRKNKRAAQAALREAQASMVEGALVNTTNAMAQSPSSRPGMDPNDLLQSLKNSVDYSGRIGNGAEAARAFMLGGPNASGGGGSSSGASQHGDFDAVFGSPDSLGGRRTPASSPGLQHRSLPHPHDSPHSPLSFASISHGNTVNFIAPGSSGLSHHLGSNGRGSVAVHAMLSEQARRLSNTSQSLSPPRPQHVGYSTSVPLAVPGALSGNGNGQSSIFGTSPFSGSRGLFIPSSYDSNEDGFPGSPPSRPAMLGDMQRSSSNSGWPSYRSNEVALADEDEGDDDGYDEGFLPSSLNDLLTPEEMRRRTLKAQNGHTPSSLGNGSPSLDHFLPSKSVPVDLLFSGGKPALPTPSGQQPQFGSATATSPWGAVTSSSSGHNPSALPFTPPQSLLAASRASSVLPVHATSPPSLSQGHYLSTSPLHPAPQPFQSSSFNDALGPQHPSRYPQSGLSPHANASLAAPGSSLPGGLAAGLSRLHLVPPTYTGETPPAGMLYSQALGASPSPRTAPATATNGISSANGHGSSGEGGASSSPTTTRSSEHPRPSPRMQGAVLGHPSPSPGSALARRLSSNASAVPPPAVASPLHHELTHADRHSAAANGGRVASGGISSAGSATGEEDLGPEDEIQFDMDA
ncbi:hypothetical protein JCM11491_007094 [Sporobolomyces phaffii]